MIDPSRYLLIEGKILDIGDHIERDACTIRPAQLGPIFDGFIGKGAVGLWFHFMGPLSHQKPYPGWEGLLLLLKHPYQDRERAVKDA